MPGMQSRARFARRGNSEPVGECKAARPLAAALVPVPGRISLDDPARFRRRSARRSAPAKQLAPPKANDLLDGFCPEPSQDEQIAVSSNGLMLFLRLADIECMEAADNCVKLRVGKQTHRLRDTLAVVAAKLPPGRFLRISRSTLVNVEHIKGLQMMFFGQYEVLLRNGSRLPLTRAYFENLRLIGIALPDSMPTNTSSGSTLANSASN
jgi:DNA-binding LytR/AlgR family response regulator